MDFPHRCLESQFAVRSGSNNATGSQRFEQRYQFAAFSKDASFFIAVEVFLLTVRLFNLESGIRN